MVHRSLYLGQLMFPFNIATLELFAAVYAAIFTWGNKLGNRQISIYTDNEAIVYVWSFDSSRDRALMHLVTLLYLVTLLCLSNIYPFPPMFTLICCLVCRFTDF